jgi:AmmeMemoRadiSam system protein B
MARIRQPAVAGAFYDDDPEALKNRVDLLLEQARGAKHKGSIVGLVSPHAGYMYSGLAAAAGYRALKGSSYDVVFIVGPSHREFFPGASIYKGDAYRTPLGDVLLDAEARGSLANESTHLKISEDGHRSEHSLEVQLPFLQRVLGSFTLVPIVIGDQTPETCFEVGRALAKVAKGRKALLVASSDLSHFHPYDDAVRLDRQVIDFVESFDETELMSQLANERLEACGGGPVVAVMHASKLLGANHSQALFYCNSGDITGDKTGVVGYLSAAFLRVN